MAIRSKSRRPLRGASKTLPQPPFDGDAYESSAQVQSEAHKVSNMLVALRGEAEVSPVINAGMLHQ